MKQFDDMRHWNIGNWQKYLQEFGLSVSAAGDFNKKSWFFSTDSRYEKNPIKNQAGWLHASFRFILPDAWKY